MKNIVLHGVLADKFGANFRMAVNSAREAAHALSCQMPDFKLFMLNSEKQGLVFAVILDDSKTATNIGEKELDNSTDAETIHIVPKIMGAGGNVFGWLQVVAGIALIGAGAVLGMNPALIGAGAGLLVGGAASLLMPNPKMDIENEDGNRPNYGFGGAVTTVSQGNPVPIAYGKRRVGGFIVSAGIYTEDNQ